MMTVLYAAGGVAGVTGLATSLAARHRVPKPFRSIKSTIAVSLACVGGKHGRCGDHLSCPCACHDDAIHRALSSSGRPTSGRSTAPFVERD
jgi:hypothetical protein